MLQVVQHIKSGEISVAELPAPLCPEGGILVRTAFSLISSGTERTSVESAQSSLLARVRKQPEQVKLVLDFIKKEGIASTFKRVQNKLDSYKSLGYSLSGVVVESGCAEFSAGDRVACAGAGFAVHAEYVAVPKNLAVRLPDNVTFEDAAYTTLASIALQGIRQADLRLGECAAVIGLGLIGQLTVQMLKASGCKVIGLDLNEKLFDLATKSGCDACFQSSSDSIKSIISAAGGIGCDAVIITAGTESNQPVELAMKIARKKGKVVVVGAVGMSLQRSPFYEKEIDFRISCSYGPGRYDPVYELQGLDYPAAYVRWTENRNMQAFVQLLSQKKIDTKLLSTHCFDIADAPRAYDLITGKSAEFYIGILLKYPEKADSDYQKRIIPVKNATSAKPKTNLKIGFIGAGTFAQSYLLPPLQQSGATLESVSTSTPANAMSAAKRFGFNNYSTGYKEVILQDSVDVLFCATRHDLHAKIVIESVKAGKAVFVEKPLAVTYDELLEIDSAVAENSGRVMVGFNRRFSDSFGAIKEFFTPRTAPMLISYRVNAGNPPRGHWVYDESQGGGRIVGEACHFIDCMVFLTGEMPVSVVAECISTDSVDYFAQDNVVITIKFSNGSVGSLQYFSNGDSTLPKEYCEVFCEGSSAVMDNFQLVKLFRNGKVSLRKFDGRKGINEEVANTIKAMKSGASMPIPYKELRAVTLVTFAARESLQSGKKIFFE
jgi:polar amino acid transport system substrate-binding protein